MVIFFRTSGSSVPSVTSQYSDASRDLRSVSPSDSPYGGPFQHGQRASAAHADGASVSRHSLDRLSSSRDSLQATATPPPLPKRGEGPTTESRFDGHFTKYLKQQQPPCYDEPKPARLGSPLRDNYVERATVVAAAVGGAMGETAAAAISLSPASVPLDLSKKKKPDAVFRYRYHYRCTAP